MATSERYYQVLPFESVGTLKIVSNILHDGKVYFLLCNKTDTFLYEYTDHKDMLQTVLQKPLKGSPALNYEIKSVHENGDKSYCVLSSGMIASILIISPSSFTYHDIARLNSCDKILASCSIGHGFAAISVYMNDVWLSIHCVTLPRANDNVNPEICHRILNNCKLRDKNQNGHFLLYKLQMSKMTKELKIILFPTLDLESTEILLICDSTGNVYYSKCIEQEYQKLNLLTVFPTYVVGVSTVNKLDNDEHNGLLFLLHTGVAHVLTVRCNLFVKKIFYIPIYNFKAWAITKTGDILFSDGVKCCLCRINYNEENAVASCSEIIVKGISSLLALDNDYVYAITNCGVSYLIKSSAISQTEENIRTLRIPDAEYFSSNVNRLNDEWRTLNNKLHRDELFQCGLSLASRGHFLREHMKPVISVYSECDLAFSDKNSKRHIIDLTILVDHPSIKIDRNIFDLHVKILKADGKEWVQRFPLDNQISCENPLHISFRTEFTVSDLTNKMAVNCVFLCYPVYIPWIIIPLETVYLDISYFYTPTNDKSFKESKSNVDICLKNINQIPEDDQIQFASPDFSLKLVDVIKSILRNATHRFDDQFLQRFGGGKRILPHSTWSKSFLMFRIVYGSTCRADCDTCFLRIHGDVIRIELVEGVFRSNGTSYIGKIFILQGDNMELVYAVKADIFQQILSNKPKVGVHGIVLPNVRKLQQDLEIMRMTAAPFQDIIFLMNKFGSNLFL